VLFLTNFSLNTFICAVFLLPAEVLVTDSELQTHISYGLVFKIWGWDTQVTMDE